MDETMTNCPGCDKHCPLTDPSCGRGRRYAEQLANGGGIEEDEQDSARHHHGRHEHGEEGGEHGRHGHDHHHHHRHHQETEQE